MRHLQQQWMSCLSTCYTTSSSVPETRRSPSKPYFGSAKMKGIFKFFRKMLQPGGIYNLLHACQIRLWYTVLANGVEVQDKTGRSGLILIKNKKESQLIELHWFPLHYMLADGSSNRSTIAGTLQPDNVAKEALHFWCMSLVRCIFWVH